MQTLIKSYNSYIHAKRYIKGNVLLITKQSIYDRYKEKVNNLLSNSKVTIFNNVIPNPNYEDVRKLVNKYKNIKFKNSNFYHQLFKKLKLLINIIKHSF